VVKFAKDCVIPPFLKEWLEEEASYGSHFL
jgi:hypothetical protein